MEEWKEYKYTDPVTIIGGGTPEASVPGYWDGEIPWLSVKDSVSVAKYVYDSEKHISELDCMYKRPANTYRNPFVSLKRIYRRESK